MRVKFWVVTFLIFFGRVISNQADPATNTVRLWPDKAPGEKGDLPAEHDTTNDKSGLVAGRRLIRLGDVSDPTLTIYPALKASNTETAVLVCPGGAYQILAMDLEGSEVCEWLNSIGVTGALLKYRVPARPGQERYLAPLQDAQRAMGWLRAHSSELGVNAKKIGVLGFSAGGHLAATLSNNYEQRKYEPIDASDQLSCRPDFTLLIYPAYLTIEKEGNKLAPEINVTPKTPPAFIVMAEDDPVRVENAIYYYLALKKAKVPAEMHLYPYGGHGYGLRDAGKNVTSWPNRAGDWLKEMGYLGNAGK
jgi:acetyl esterase/lipase